MPKSSTPDAESRTAGNSFQVSAVRGGCVESVVTSQACHFWKRWTGMQYVPMGPKALFPLPRRGFQEYDVGVGRIPATPCRGPVLQLKSRQFA